MHYILCKHINFFIFLKYRETDIGTDTKDCENKKTHCINLMDMKNKIYIIEQEI